MDRRRFLAGIGLFSIGGATGAGVAAGVTPGSGAAAEGPTARTAAPGGSGAFAATATFRTSPAAKVVALTIDDGPTREWTPRLLDILRHRNARATFYRVGERALAAPGLVKQTAAEGHEQGNHTWAHDDLTQHDGVFDLTTLRRTHDLLAELTGRAPATCRPPYGRVDSVGIAACASMHYGITLWSSHVTGSNAAADVDAVVRRVSPGTIILAHDGGSEPNATLMKQLDRLVATLADSGYQFVTISELLADKGAHLIA